MGCQVEKTDTGVEIEIHVFNTSGDATHYITRPRGYKFDRHEPCPCGGNMIFYRGPVEGEWASIRNAKDGAWRACFWIEGDAKVKQATPVQGKPAWFGYARVKGEWQIVCNGAGNAISYASIGAALAGAKLIAMTVRANDAT